MLAQFLATVLAGATAQAASTPAQNLPAAAAPRPAANPNVASEEELKRLLAELPKVAKSVELLNVREVFSAMDYPTEAIANEEQGTVHAWLLITADGRVQRCGIRQSSGSAALDAQTCDLFVAKAQFRPARGKGGRPVASIHEQRLTWRLEGGRPEIGNQIVKEHFIVGPNGEVRCSKAEFRIAANHWMEGPKKRCEAFAERAPAVLLDARKQSKLHDAHAVLELRVFTEASEEMAPVATDPGDTLVYLRRATMSYDRSGKRTSCATHESFGPEPKPEPCADPEFDQLPANMMRAAAGANVRFLWAIYLKNEPK